MRKAKPGELVAADIEMFGMTKPHLADGDFACISIGFENGDTFLVKDENDLPHVLEDIQAGQWVMQNALFDLRILRRYVDVPQRYVHDTMLIEMDMFSGWYSRFGLDALVRRWLGRVMSKEVRKTFEKSMTMTPEMEQYALNDASETVLIAKKQLAYIYKEFDGQMPWYSDIDELAIWAVLDMPPANLNREAWLAHAESMAQNAEERQEALGVNVYSHQTVKPMIEKKLGRGIRNTNANQTLIPLLGQIEPDHPAAEFIREVMEIRSLRKMVETYGEAWLKDVMEDGSIYADWKIVGTITGRMACAEPNLQNVPKRDMPIYRSFFPASTDYEIQVADISQQEPWFSAYLSGDEVLLKELHERVDLHKVTGDLFGVDRPSGKAINLGLNYGMSEYGLAARVGISVEEALSGIKARERYYRQLHGWQGTQMRNGRVNYKVHTVTGRPVWLNPYSEGWERQAINAPCQGSAADHTKRALVKIHQKCAEARLPFRVTMIIHDEIVQDVPLEHKEQYADILKSSWDEASAELAPGMGLRADVLHGDTWGAKED